MRPRIPSAILASSILLLAMMGQAGAAEENPFPETASTSDCPGPEASNGVRPTDLIARGISLPCVVASTYVCDAPSYVFIATGDGHHQCTSGNQCLSGGSVHVIIVGNRNRVCASSAIACSGNVALIITIVGDNNIVCGASGPSGGTVCSGNIVAAFRVIGDGNIHCGS